ncbi:cTPxI [Polyrhizophydium stewartii]|uniref:CTPxI n=1 Tax=Polyrhizophydium stewartii TaxID=2732419 RepID=A0ABR4N8M5_9FUNG|nr:Peroxiredoxin-1 [Polyrhizophydium stewartii]
MHHIARVQHPAPAWSARAVVNKQFVNLSSQDFAGKWLVLFFYPLDFTFVCPTEIIAFSERIEEFRKLNAEVVGASIDSVHSHLAWINMPRKEGGLGHMNIPLISDVTKNIAHEYGVLVDSGKDIGLALRGTFIIDPKGIVRQITINDTPVGRSVDETLRLVEALQFADEHGRIHTLIPGAQEVCPAGWKKGQKSMVADPVKSKDYFRSVNDN